MTDSKPNGGWLSNNLGGLLALIGVVGAVIVSFQQVRGDVNLLRKDIHYLQLDVQEIRQTGIDDRWRASDDRLFMEHYSQINNLKMTSHGGQSP